MAAPNPSSRPPIPDEAAAAVRATPEYAAAFDIELWKAEQRRLHIEAMEQDAVAQRQRLEEEYKLKDAERVAEIERYRKELSGMALRMREQGTALEQRIASVEERESAFEARRLGVAKKHEEHLLEVESRARRQVEEERLKQETLQSRVVERDAVVAQTQRQLAVLQGDFDALQRAMTKVHTKDGDLKDALRLADARVDDLTKMLQLSRQECKAWQTRWQDLSGKHEELVDACNFYKKQVKDITAKYNDLALVYNEKKEKDFVKEQRQLQADKREHEARAALGHQNPNIVPAVGPTLVTPAGQKAWAHDVVINTFYGLQQQQKDTKAGGVSGSSGNGGNSDIAALRSIVEQLADDAKKTAEEQQKEEEKKRTHEKRRERRRREKEAEARRKAEADFESDSAAQQRWVYARADAEADAAFVGGAADGGNLALPGLPAPMQSPYTLIQMASASEEESQKPSSFSRRNGGNGHANRTATSGARKRTKVDRNTAASSSSWPEPSGSHSSHDDFSASESVVRVSSNTVKFNSDIDVSSSSDDEHQRRHHHPKVADAFSSTHFGSGDPHQKSLHQPNAIGAGLAVIPPQFPEVDALEYYTQQGVLAPGQPESFRATPASTTAESPKPTLMDQLHPELSDAFPSEVPHTRGQPRGPDEELHRPAPAGLATTVLPPASASVGTHPSRADSVSTIALSPATDESTQDIIDFVKRMATNRNRLLSTGVYTPDDPLIAELDRKIDSYTSYLTAQGVSFDVAKDV